MYEENDNTRPRSLFYLLIPMLLGIFGSIILHLLLRKDNVKFKDINIFNWTVGVIVTFTALIDLYVSVETIVNDLAAIAVDI